MISRNLGCAMFLATCASCGGAASGGETADDTESESTAIALVGGRELTVAQLEIAEIIPNGKLGYIFSLATPIPIQPPIEVDVGQPGAPCKVSFTHVTQVGPGPKAMEYQVTPAEACALENETSYGAHGETFRVSQAGRVELTSQ